MAKLTTAERNKLPDSDFALPGRKDPIEDREHAIKALQLGRPSPAQRKEILSKVRKKFPGVGSSIKPGNY